jgi:ABC-2 type transport system ATP-binding protein
MNLTKRYTRQRDKKAASASAVAALDGINLAINPGRIVGLLGPNGSGKTTFIKLVNGLLKPSSGGIKICGYDVGAESKALTSYLPDRICLDPQMKIRDLVTLYADFYADFQREYAHKMLADLYIDLNKTLKTLSKGNKEKVQLVLVMSRRAKLFLLDEPIGGVDPAARDYIISTIMDNYNSRKNSGAIANGIDSSVVDSSGVVASDNVAESHSGATLVISTHLIQDVEPILDDIIFLKNGKIILEGDADEIRSQNSCSIDELFREVFKC